MKGVEAITVPTFDQGGLASSYVSLSSEEAEDLLRAEFEITGQLTKLATEKDDTFRVDAADGRRYILKVANPSETRTEIDFQVALLDHVAASDATIPAPRIIGHRSGQRYISTIDRAG